MDAQAGLSGADKSTPWIASRKRQAVGARLRAKGIRDRGRSHRELGEHATVEGEPALDWHPDAGSRDPDATIRNNHDRRHRDPIHASPDDTTYPAHFPF